MNSPSVLDDQHGRAVLAAEIRADHGITGYTFSMGSQSQPLSEIESPRSMFAKSRLVSGRLAWLAFCKAAHVFLTRLITDLCKSYRILVISSIALLTTYSLNVVGAEGTLQADASQPVIEGMGLTPTTQPLRASGLMLTDFSVSPDQDSQNTLPDPITISVHDVSIIKDLFGSLRVILRIEVT